MVSGTNGKTTTTHFLAAAVRASLGDAGMGPRGARLVHNADGANLHHGIASALSEHPEAEIAILETDERVVADMIRLGKPEVLVLLNFSRDQLDRHHEIKGLGRSWRDALTAAGARRTGRRGQRRRTLDRLGRADRPRGRLGGHRDHLDPGRIAVPELRIQPGPRAARPHRRLGGDWHCTGCDLAQPDGRLPGASTARSWTAIGSSCGIPN